MYSPDLYIRDNYADNGTEPNVGTTNYSYSPDIWITTTSGSMVSCVEEGVQYLVRVRIHNNDTINSGNDITVRLNWSRNSNDMSWSKSWNGSTSNQRSGLVGELLLNGPIRAGQDTVVTFEWTIPVWMDCPIRQPRAIANSGWQCSLIAQVNDGHITNGIDRPDYSVQDFVLNNNNVAMKNCSVIIDNGVVNIVSVDMRWAREDRPIRLTYRSSANNNGTYISDVANVYFQFDSNLLANWPMESRIMSGCHMISDSICVITDTLAYFDGFLLDTLETYFISTFVRYRTVLADSTKHCYTLEIDALDGDNVLSEGGIDFITMYDEAVYFNVTAYEDMTVMAGETFELSAEADAADATFEWYNMQDVLIGTGDHISLSSTSTQQYYVRGYSPSDNTVGYDTVAVTVRHGIITKITPNPAHNQVLVKYTLADDVTNPTISLRNSNGMVVYSASIGTHPALCHINIKTIDVVPLPTGNYTVSLEDNGVVLDSKTLVVQ
jgi:hypothetical protein